MILYHLSDKYLGNEIILNPKIPRDVMKTENKKIKRICVSNNIIGCLIALKNTFYNKGFWFLYLINVNENKIYDPIKVPDKKTTNEVWILNKIRGKYAGKISDII